MRDLASIMSYDYRSRSDFCRAERQWLLETAEALVAIESPTTDKTAVDRCGAELASRLEAIGGRVTRLARAERGNHLLAEFGCGTSQILLLGHFDTVWPVGQLERMPLARSNGRLHGPGVFDMKAGIAIAMLATRALLEGGPSLSHRIVMLWTTDEEIGSETSRAAIEEEAARSAAVLVLEPSLPGGALKTSRKGCGGYQLDGARRRRARRHRAAEGRERRAGAGAPDSGDQRAAGSRTRHLRQRRAGERRAAVERHPGRGACRGRRARADGGRRGARSRRRSALSGPSTSGRPSRRAAGSTGRRWNAVTRLRVFMVRLEMSRASLGRSSAKAAPAAGRTGISPPRSGSPP